MNIREKITNYSKGDDMDRFWKLFWRRERTKNRFLKDIVTFRLSRLAHRHGGYVGSGARFAGVPTLPHGLHGVYISRYAVIGKNCRIYQNVTIGEVERRAPAVGDNCLIGAGAVLIGGIRIGDNVKIGAGAVITPTCRTTAPWCPRLRESSKRGRKDVFSKSRIPKGPGVD